MTELEIQELRATVVEYEKRVVSTDEQSTRRELIRQTETLKAQLHKAEREKYEEKD